MRFQKIFWYLSRISILVFIWSFLAIPSSFAQKLLIPMDGSQNDHLRAYGLAFWALEPPREYRVKWLLNYRAGSFLMADTEDIRMRAILMGVSYQLINDAEESAIYSEIEQNNMDIVLLEKAPKIAVYAPLSNEPWDDAVTLSLTYAQIDYKSIYDSDILAGTLVEYDWIHLHHEDFTGQYGKFYGVYHNETWYQQMVARFEEEAKKAGYDSVPKHKGAVADAIRDYVLQGGFLFMMEADPLDIALAAKGVDIVAPQIDGTPIAQIPASNHWKHYLFGRINGRGATLCVESIVEPLISRRYSDLARFRISVVGLSAAIDLTGPLAVSG